MDFVRKSRSVLGRLRRKVGLGPTVPDGAAPWLSQLRDGRFPVENDTDFSYPAGQVPLPSFLLRQTVSRPDLGGFYFIGESWALAVSRQLAGMADANPLVLDIGCGIGKTARMLALDSRIRYVGFDIFRPAIDWCRGAFGETIGDRFRFEHFDGVSEFYNPGGTIRPVDYEFPVADGSVDVAFAASLFTHLHEPDMRAYLAQIARKLKPTGRAVLSIHGLPKDAEADISGTEQCIMIKPGYFAKLGREYGLRHTGERQHICGQLAMTFERA